MFSKEEKQALTEEFWAELKNKSKAKYGRRHTWMLNKTGIKGLQLKFNITRKSASVILQCYELSDEKKSMLFDIIKQYHIVILDITEIAPTWDKEGTLEGMEGSPAVYFTLENVDYLQRKYWDEIHDFFIDRMKRLEDAFLEIKDVLKVEAKALL